jgi:hypothetical protein
MKDEIIQKIREAGVPEQEIQTFYNLLSEEVLDLLFQDLAEKQTDEELTIIENRIKDAKSTEHLEAIIQELALTTYEENAAQEINNMYLDLIDDFKKNVEDAKALIQRANQGDKDAIELLNKAMDTDMYKSIMGLEE